MAICRWQSRTGGSISSSRESERCVVAGLLTVPPRPTEGLLHCATRTTYLTSRRSSVSSTVTLDRGVTRVASDAAKIEAPTSDPRSLIPGYAIPAAGCRAGSGLCRNCRRSPVGIADAFWLSAVGRAGVWLALWTQRCDRLSIAAVLAVVTSVGGAWHHLYWHFFGADEIGRFARELPAPVCIEGLATAGRGEFRRRASIRSARRSPTIRRGWSFARAAFASATNGDRLPAARS